MSKEKHKDNLKNKIISNELPKTVFLSYDWRNKNSAKRLASRLQKDGIGVWIDKPDIEPDEEIDKEIEENILKCPVFFPLISEESQRTKNRKVRGKVNRDIIFLNGNMLITVEKYRRNLKLFLLSLTNPPLPINILQNSMRLKSRMVTPSAVIENWEKIKKNPEK